MDAASFFNSLNPSDACMRQYDETLLVHIMPFRRQVFIWTNSDLFPDRSVGTNVGEIQIKIIEYPFSEKIWICRQKNGG